jgi:hypothetical protein
MGQRTMATNFSGSITAWWITASDKNPENPPWRWEWFFQNPSQHREERGWGGPDWINSYISFARIREMRKGDAVIAYQAGEGIVGLAYLDSDGYQFIEGGEYDTFDLKPSPTVWLNMVVPYSVIRGLPEAHDNIEFVRIHQGTVFEVTSKGFDAILQCILDLNRNQAKEVRRFLSHSKSQ